ncbi:Probable ubiquitin-conjugating enzyme E2 W [Babesia microti strain RI]|uniref:Probable ubiquitin-conjugating enzyme E2 W n=1 Tax=Babesia microti (strain RI) TaxID=1133968 RepID=I7I8T7_BABMR|nr:Probable ubiquitin-conjugating enzyme E2 W [Babesia microti strain RI]CCF73658.1 Probable ubiquitin-conjugating enzyme E2 W [Babesia microti strain RI]|eukprot:XP_012648267.1 Probable ubiquitin-conjugating enzyme E2 W [Babesia microti strain RI]
MHCLALVISLIPIVTTVDVQKNNSLKKTYFGRRLRFNVHKTLSLGIGRTPNFKERLIREEELFRSNPPQNCELITTSRNLRIWLVRITGLEGTIYEGEPYTLKIIFPNDYPLKPPIMYFLKPTPTHEHVYSNGDICLSALGTDYAPNASVSSLILSLVSMLSSAKEKRRPPDDQLHAQMPPGESDASYVYHDDKC